VNSKLTVPDNDAHARFARRTNDDLRAAMREHWRQPRPPAWLGALVTALFSLLFVIVAIGVWVVLPSILLLKVFGTTWFGVAQ
jgi:hypothetical protein